MRSLVLMFALSAAAFADVSGTVTLTASTPALNLDTGTTGASGGDLLWSGGNLTPQSKAGAFSLGPGAGAAAFGALDKSTLSFLQYSSAAMSSVLLPVNTVFAVKTNAGNYAKLLVTAISGSTSITLQYLTYGGAAATTGPTVTQIQNNYSYIQDGFPNYGIAPGALFIVKGTGLSAPASAVLQSSAAPGIPLTLNGSSVSVTVNGTTVRPGFYYAIPTQLALVLPNNTPAGTGTLTVTVNGVAGTPATIKVVASALGFDTLYGTGTGLAVATNNLTGAVFTPASSAAPGQTIVLWGSGLGATADSDYIFTTTPHAATAPLTIYIGGLSASIGYGGASGYPGVNQINVTIPAGVTTGCNVSVVAISGTIVSNTVTLPIAVGGGQCSDPSFGTTGNQQQQLSGQATVKTGFVLLVHSVSPGNTAGTTQVNDLAESSFSSQTGSNYGANGGNVSLGGCIVTQIIGSTPATTTGLDAGVVTVTGPTGSATLNPIPNLAGISVASLATGFIPSTGGTFTFRGAGGRDVGSFTTTVVFPNPLLVWTNAAAAATVNRSQGQQITWTGGGSGTYVVINGSSAATVGGQSLTGSYTCLAPVSAQQFTVPSYILLALPAGTGTTNVQNGTNYQTFTASGIDIGLTYGDAQQSVSSTFN